ncbi:TetR/AcrR family transcriptional regulator [Novilysobacter erysipheiresistens]|uniref:Helix-turn-helix domain-containing protein n=1 Tax=Novilysobacter erysipheiresistens TaxID=1749332 RepID=A0ABU7Z125_9GAMM
MSTKQESTKAQERAEMQRHRILDAAQQCFIAHGFHAASMASIADTAGMSAGLIYRYFENKNAIVLAIVDRQLQLLRENIRLNRRVDLAAEWTQNYGRSCAAEAKGMNAALLLEMSAEATRDPQIAAALDHYDTTLRAALVDWLTGDPQAGGHGLPAAIAPYRALLLQCLFEGLKLRETREPDLDRALLSSALHEFIPMLLKP